MISEVRSQSDSHETRGRDPYPHGSKPTEGKSNHSYSRDPSSSPEETKVEETFSQFLVKEIEKDALRVSQYRIDYHSEAKEAIARLFPDTPKYQYYRTNSQETRGRGTPSQTPFGQSNQSYSRTPSPSRNKIEEAVSKRLNKDESNIEVSWKKKVECDKKNKESSADSSWEELLRHARIAKKIFG